MGGATNRASAGARLGGMGKRQRAGRDAGSPVVRKGPGIDGGGGEKVTTVGKQSVGEGGAGDVQERMQEGAQQQTARSRQVARPANKINEGKRRGS